MDDIQTGLAESVVQRPSVTDLLGALHAERVATWAPEALQINIDQRRRLVDAFGPEQAIAAGEPFPDFDLAEVDGGRITLAQLLADTGAVVLFFRHAGCPACNIAIPHYAQTLHPELAARGIPLVAISPQPAERLVLIKRRHQLGFPVLSDEGNQLARSLGILYTFDEASRRSAEASGGDSRALNGTDRWELPMPAAFVIDAGGIVRLAAVAPDWMVRAETPHILSAVDRL